MTIRVELNIEIEALLREQARAQGLPLEKIAEQLLVKALVERSSRHGRMTVEEFHRMLEGMAQDSERLPDLPTESFSRESFYQDRLDGRDELSRR